MLKLSTTSAKNSLALNQLILAHLNKTLGRVEEGATNLLLPVRLQYLGSRVYVPLNALHAPLSLPRWFGDYSRAAGTLGLILQSYPAANITLAPYEVAASGHHFYNTHPATPAINAYARALKEADAASYSPCDLADLTEYASVKRPRAATP